MRLIDEWNGVDTSQLASTHAFASSGQTITPSVITGTAYPFGAILRLDGTSSGTSGSRAAVLLVESSRLSELTDPNVFVIELGVLTVSANYAGISFFGDLEGGAGHYYGYQYVFGAAGWRSRVDNGTLNIGAGTSDNCLPTATDGVVRIYVNGKRAPGARPTFALSAEGVNAAGTEIRGSLQTSNWNGEPATGWTSLVNDRWGFAMQAGGGGSFGTLDLHYWRLWDPLDSGGGDADAIAPTVAFSPAP